MVTAKPWRRRVLFALAALAGIVLLLAGGIIALMTVDLRPWIERAASSSLHRKTQIGALRITWGRHVALEAGDIRLANTAWASSPDMLRIGRLSAVIDLTSLLRGVVRYETLHVDDMTLLLERAADGGANWKFGAPGRSGGGATTKGGLELVPKNRTQFPTLIDFVLTNGRVIYRHVGASDIDIGFKRATIAAPGESTPVQLAVDGSYNGTPARITGPDMGSFDEMRDATQPYKGGIDLVTGSAALHLQGKYMEPLDFEGVSGPMRIDVHSLGGLLKVFGVDGAPSVPLRIAGEFAHEGDLWRLDKASGDLVKDAFTGTLALDEGKRGESDRLRPDLDFATLDLGPLLGGGSGGGMTLGTPAKPGLLVDGDVRARQLTWSKYRATDVALHAATTGPNAKAMVASFGFSGGKAEVKVHVAEAPGSGHIAAAASLTGADVAGIAHLAGVATSDLAGTLTGNLALDMQGATLQRALTAGNGQMVVSIANGAISDGLLEKASTDLRALFRSKPGLVPLSCFLAVTDLKDGIVYFDAVRLRAADVQLEAHGLADLAHQHVDIVVRSRSGAALALDHPLSVRGPLAKPSIGLGDGRSLALPALPPPPAAWVAANPCRS
jgi:uncharacterized protein involved in outer membrane biogenesis